MNRVCTLLLVDDCAEDRAVYRRFLQKQALTAPSTDFSFTNFSSTDSHSSDSHSPAFSSPESRTATHPCNANDTGGGTTSLNLANLSLQIIEAESGEQGLQTCQQTKFDLILLDFRLPDMDGLEFLAALQQREASPPPVVVLSGQGNETIAVQVIKSGAQDYLVKQNLTAELLHQTLCTALEQADRQQAFTQRQQYQQWLADLVLRMQRSPALPELLDRVVGAVQQRLKADRVFICQIAPDNTGTIVAEAVLPGWPPCQHYAIPAGNWQSYGSEQDIQQNPECNGLEGRETGNAGYQGRTIANLPAAGLPDCYLRLQEQGQVKSALVVPIRLPDALDHQGQAINAESGAPSRFWGVLAVHQCAEFRTWQAGEREVLETVAAQIAVAIQQAQRWEQVQAELAERQLLFETNPNPMWIYDPDTLRFIAVNQAAIATYGYSEAEFLAMTIADIRRPEDRADLRNTIASLPANSPARECRHCKRDGTVLVVEVTSHAIVWQGKPSRCVLVKNVSQSKRTEAALRQLNQELERRVQERSGFLQLAVSAAQMGFWEWDMVENIQRWSPENYELLGFQTDAFGRVLDNNGVEVSPTPTSELFFSRVHPEDRERLIQAQEIALERRSMYEADHRLIWSDGSIRWRHSRGTYLYDWQGYPIKLVGVSIDITKRKQAEERLRQSEERLHIALEAAQMGAWEVNLLTMQQSWSVQTEILFGFPPGEYDGSMEVFRSRIHPDDRAAQVQAFESALQTGAYRAEYRIVLPDRSLRWIGSQGRIFYDELGRPLYMSGVDADITERKQAEEQIKATLEEKEVLLKEVHHRVKNNLQVIMSLLRMQARCVSDPQVLGLLQESQNRIQSMATIHEQLYQSSDLAQIDFGEYVRALVSNLFRSYGVSQATIGLQIKTHGLKLTLTTAIPCGLVVNELVSNSLKHAFPEGRVGKIQIQLQPTILENKAALTLSVIDNGIGIPETLDWQTSHSLGLRIVRNLATQLRGKLVYRGQGETAFYLSFPI